MLYIRCSSILSRKIDDVLAVDRCDPALQGARKEPKIEVGIADVACKLSLTYQVIYDILPAIFSRPTEPI